MTPITLEYEGKKYAVDHIPNAGDFIRAFNGKSWCLITTNNDKSTFLIAREIPTDAIKKMIRKEAPAHVPIELYKSMTEHTESWKEVNMTIDGAEDMKMHAWKIELSENTEVDVESVCQLFDTFRKEHLRLRYDLIGFVDGGVWYFGLHDDLEEALREGAGDNTDQLLMLAERLAGMAPHTDAILNNASHLEKISGKLPKELTKYVEGAINERKAELLYNQKLATITTKHKGFGLNNNQELLWSHGTGLFLVFYDDQTANSAARPGRYNNKDVMIILLPDTKVAIDIGPLLLDMPGYVDGIVSLFEDAARKDIQMRYDLIVVENNKIYSLATVSDQIPYNGLRHRGTTPRHNLDVDIVKFFAHVLFENAEEEDVPFGTVLDAWEMYAGEQNPRKWKEWYVEGCKETESVPENVVRVGRFIQDIQRKK